MHVPIWNYAYELPERFTSLDELLRDGEEAENANGNLQEQKLYDDILAATRRYLENRK